MNIIRIDKTTSTITTLKELALNRNLEEGTVLVTDNQTAGRGQAETSWESEPGKNLTFSMVFYPCWIPIQKQFILSQIISLSLKEVLSKYVSYIRIKWPNDIYYREQKIVGTLIENEINGSEISLSIIGAGINVNQEIFRSDAPNPVSLKQITGQDISLDEILEQVVNQIMANYEKALNGMFDSLTRRYHDALYRNDGFYPYSDKNGLFNAAIEEVKDNGILVLKTDTGELRSYMFKEVVYL